MFKAKAKKLLQKDFSLESATLTSCISLIEELQSSAYFANFAVLKQTPIFKY